MVIATSSVKKRNTDPGSSCRTSLGLRLPMYIYMKLSTENIKLNLHVHGLLYLIIYIRTSKLKPKLIP